MFLRHWAASKFLWWEVHSKCMSEKGQELLWCCLFLRLYFNFNISPFPFLLQISTIYLCLVSFKFMVSFPSIVIVCIYAYDSTYLFLYNLLSTYNVTCIYVSRAGHLSVDNQSVCSSLQRVPPSTPSFTQLLLVLCGRLRPCGLFLIHFDMSIDVSLVQLIIGWSWW